MTATYENDFVPFKMNFILMYLHKVAVKILAIPIVKRYMPFFNIYFVAIFKYSQGCSHPLIESGLSVSFCINFAVISL